MSKCPYWADRSGLAVGLARRPKLDIPLNLDICLNILTYSGQL